MPQQPSPAEDDGPPDETKTYHTEGEQEEKISENVRESFDHLNDVKSSLVNEGESSSSSGKSSTGSQRNKRLGPQSIAAPSEYGDSSKDARIKKLHGATHGGEGSKLDHFHDISRFAVYNNLAIIAGGYHPNGSMVPVTSGNKLSMVHPSGHYPPSLAHLMMYNQDHYPPGTPPPPHLPGTIEVDSKTGIARPRHPELPLYHSLSPGSLGSVPHHLEVYNVPWQGQPFYPLTGALRSPYPTLINASGMSRLGHPGMPPPHHGMAVTGIPHPAIVTSGTRQLDTLQQSNDRQPPPKDKPTKQPPPEKRQPHIKKPLNAFMLYMKEKRASVVKECTLKESAAINQILGRRWHALSREEQAKYYELARKERQLHMQLYPSWTARDNYAVHGKKKKKKKDKNPGDSSEPSTPKKCRARFGVDQQEFWCKPCRRKKKCIRYICSDENGQSKDDDSCESDDDQNISSPSSQRMKDEHDGSGRASPTSATPPMSNHSNGSHSNHSRERGSVPLSSSSSELRPFPSSSLSTSSSSSSSSSLKSNSTQQPPPSSAMHPTSHSPVIAQSSPTIVHHPLHHPLHSTVSHAPPPVGHHHMSFTSTPPMMVFPTQPPPPLFTAHTTAGSPGDILRGPPAFPNGLMPHGLLQLHQSSRQPQTPEMPQDLSMKSATVTA